MRVTPTGTSVEPKACLTVIVSPPLGPEEPESALPQAAAGKMETRPNIVPITVTDKGDVLYDKDELPNEDLADKMKASLASDPDTVFVLRGDKKADYEAVVRVLDLLKRSGAKHVSIATETAGRQ